MKPRQPSANNAALEGSGTMLPRISPLPFVLVWMLM
jgi:hypothetical protein